MRGALVLAAGLLATREAKADCSDTWTQVGGAPALTGSMGETFWPLRDSGFNFTTNSTVDAPVDTVNVTISTVGPINVTASSCPPGLEISYMDIGHVLSMMVCSGHDLTATDFSYLIRGLSIQQDGCTPHNPYDCSVIGSALTVAEPGCPANPTTEGHFQIPGLVFTISYNPEDMSALKEGDSATPNG